MDVRKARKIVMKVKLCKTRPIKRISKTFAYLIGKTNEKIGLKKLLNFCLIVYFTKILNNKTIHIANLMDIKQVKHFIIYMYKVIRTLHIIVDHRMQCFMLLAGHAV